jgi:polysaccharide export outer membrane protein
MYKKINVIAIILFIITSCSINKKMVYFQGDDFNNEIVNNYQVQFKVNDLLSIQVFTSDIESSKPFNLSIQNINQINTNYTSGSPSPAGYLVDNNGYINFPVIGKTYVLGLTKIQLVEQLNEKLESYVKDPVIDVKILNFKVTVLGDVAKPGTFNIPNEKITILEALGIAGDLNITGLRKNVTVIREQNGVKIKILIDLSSNNMFSSPAYYLSQNDVVYIEPSRVKINSALINTSNAGIIISGASILLTSILLILK